MIPLPEQAVQIVILTVNHQRYTFVGPVVHDPIAGLSADTVQEISFGEIIPISLAKKLFNGEIASIHNIQ